MGASAEARWPRAHDIATALPFVAAVINLRAHAAAHPARRLGRGMAWWPAPAAAPRPKPARERLRAARRRDTGISASATAAPLRTRDVGCRHAGRLGPRRRAP